MKKGKVMILKLIRHFGHQGLVCRCIVGGAPSKRMVHLYGDKGIVCDSKAIEPW